LYFLLIVVAVIGVVTRQHIPFLDEKFENCLLPFVVESIHLYSICRTRPSLCIRSLGFVLVIYFRRKSGLKVYSEPADIWGITVVSQASAQRGRPNVLLLSRVVQMCCTVVTVLSPACRALLLPSVSSREARHPQINCHCELRTIDCKTRTSVPYQNAV
jgi:hypothetical protein